MTTLREAAQQALEAWQTATYGHPSHHKATLLAITALRAALAQPQIDPVDEYRKGFIAGQIDMRDREETKAEPVKPVATLIAQRDALLEALKAVEPLLTSEVRKKVSAVIKAVEETK